MERKAWDRQGGRGGSDTTGMGWDLTNREVLGEGVGGNDGGRVGRVVLASEYLCLPRPSHRDLPYVGRPTEIFHQTSAQADFGKLN